MEIAPTLCKGIGRRLQGHRLVESELAFVIGSPENRVRPLWRWGDLVRPPHLSNIDVPPLTRKELREYILVSSLRLFRFPTFTCCYYLLACILSYRIVHLVAYLDNLYSCQALI